LIEQDRIAIEEVKKRLDAGKPIFFIDTRSVRDWNASDIKIKGAHRIHFSELMDHLNEIPHDRIIIAYCT
jgi:rhodanese-related sulfurtransferase